MSRTKTAVIYGVSALGAAAVLALGASAIANADTTSSSSTTSSNTTTSPEQGTAPQGTPPQDTAPQGTTAGPGDSSHAGPGETLLTGTTAEKVKAAALKAVPGATIVRVETDSGSATYEAHVTTSSGATKTVKINADFSVAAVQDGMGTGPSGSQPGGPGAGSPSTSGSAA